MRCCTQAALRLPFSRGVAAVCPTAAVAGAAAPQPGASPCRASWGASPARGFSAAVPSRAPVLRHWGGRGHVQPPQPLQGGLPRRWHGVVAMAKGGKGKKKQDDSELPILHIQMSMSAQKK